MTTTCAAGDCDRPVYARGCCSRHYRQLLRHGEVRPDPSPAACSVSSCPRRAVTRGWCHGHYLRWSRRGDVQEDVPLARPVRDDCSMTDCGRGAHSAGLCRAHAARLHRYGDPGRGGPLRQNTGGGSLNHGYWWVSVGPDRRHLVPDGRKADFEHRLVVAEALGRPLSREEVVHHRNGDRLDNRLANLELWTTAQPKGQRVADKLAFALTLLQRYDPAGRHSLSPDVDALVAPPVETRRPATSEE